jgi:hypothetical protein
VWAELEPPKGTVYNYPLRPHHDAEYYIVGSTGPPDVGVQIWSQSMIPGMVARVVTGQTAKQVINWAKGKLEGNRREADASCDGLPTRPRSQPRAAGDAGQHDVAPQHSEWSIRAISGSDPNSMSQSIRWPIQLTLRRMRGMCRGYYVHVVPRELSATQQISLTFPRLLRAPTP